MKEKNKIVITLYLLLFPVFVAFSSELNVIQSAKQLLEFVESRTIVMLFNVLFIGAVYGLLTLIVKKLWISTLAVGVTFYVFSCVEYFKYGVSGTHFIVTDLMMAGSVGDISRFAKIVPTAYLVINLIILIGAIVVSIPYELEFKVKYLFVRITASLALVLLVLCVVLPTFSSKMYDAFDIDTTESTNAFVADKKYENNQFIANFIQSSSEAISKIVVKPDGYGKNAVSKIVDFTNSAYTESESEDDDGANVVFIIDEAFGDFRTLEGIGSRADGIYNKLDEVATFEEVTKHQIAVPTFGGYTVRTEFELMMGLPVKSVNDNTMPQQAIKTLDNVTTVVSRFRDAGYRTSYIHPFTETFYERNEVYPSYGFEDVYFEDAFVNLTEGDYHNTYIKDAVVFSKIKELLSSENEGYDCIYTMTMQNHQPYDSQDELSAYLAGVEKTCDALYDFLSWVREFDEKTVVVFIGDHYPFFSMESNVYSTFDINADNCYSLYNQTCYIFDSEKKITSSDSIVSAFYLPYFIMDRVGIEDDNVTRFFKSCYEMYPVYTTNVPGSPDKLKQVDMICYDLIVGEKYSLQK